MPKIRIVEKDMTNALASVAGENVIFLVDSGLSEIVEINSLSDLEKQTNLTKKAIMEKILRRGGKIIAAGSYASAKEFLSDRNQFDVKILLVDEGSVSQQSGGESGDEDVDVSDLTAALEIAEKRKDVAVFYGKTHAKYFPAEEELLSQEMSSTDAFVNTEYRKYLGKFVLPFVAKSLVADEQTVAESAVLSYLKMVADGNAEWLAFAGSKRGVVPGATNCGYLTEDEIDELQPSSVAQGEIAFAMNPICKVNPWGIRIWGSRTGMPLGGDDKTMGLVAQSFANIRILICDIKKKLYSAAREFQFEPDTDVLWVNFTGKVNVLLEEMKQSYGIAGYKWIQETTPDRAKIKAKLRIIPIEPVEDFDLTLELADSLEVAE